MAIFSWNRFVVRVQPYSAEDISYHHPRSSNLDIILSVQFAGISSSHFGPLGHPSAAQMVLSGWIFIACWLCVSGWVHDLFSSEAYISCCHSFEPLSDYCIILVTAMTCLVSTRLWYSKYTFPLCVGFDQTGKVTARSVPLFWYCEL